MVHFQKGKRNIRTKKNQKNVSDDEDNVLEHTRQNMSSSSEEECNGSQELSGVASSNLSSKDTPIMNGKTRASRGAATDPQSLYARVSISIVQYSPIPLLHFSIALKLMFQY